MSLIRVVLLVLVLGLLGGGAGHLGSFFDQLGAGIDGIAIGDGAESAKASPDRSGSCDRQRGAVVVRLDRSRYPGTAAHVRSAIAAGQPRTLHLDRAGADANRDQSLAGIATKDGYDRDEWPMAVSREGGAGADIAYVESADNRGAGSVVGAQLSDYCDGQAFRVRLVR